ncbi:DUF3800 domain-containing protein [uncultured Flavobacterium sp.]|uniref:DUF3800 domain-containing protein n=1 Tax=uncultured Flavobacterium sp. TaxID=165435 RepID=UPI0025F691D8|nr:DUF3800 domain-containing protein [uncultured Flavobacterium sp.]
MEIFFDEAGNSGQNLLDSDQPVYVLVSHNFSIEEANDILSPIKTMASEIHFKGMRKYPKYQKPLEQVLNDERIDYDRVKIAYYNKKFSLCAHLSDQLVETVFYHLGIDFNANWMNVKYATGLFLCTITGELVPDYEELLMLFQKMIRLKQDDAIMAFYNHAAMMYEKITDEGQKNFFAPILQSSRYIEDIMESINKFSIDLSLPGLIILSDAWTKKSGQRIDIVHDDSKQVTFWKDYIYFLSYNIGDDKTEVGYDSRKMTFPLQIDSVKLVDSKDFEQVQLSDLLGSAFAHYAKNILLDYGPNDKVAKIIAGTRLGKMEVHPLQPDLSVMDIMDVDTSGDSDPLEFIAKKAMENEELYRKSYPR